jgi:replication factor C subunit 3/5
MEYNLPWVEKYRPKCLDDIVGQNKIINSLKNIFDGGSFPHLLFYGGSGSGKTSTILAILNDYFGKKKKLMVMRLDASDDRGINSVREEIKGFAEKKNYFSKGIKVIILDEADSMTFDAQFALRRIIEKYSNNTRFCLICNYDNKIIPAIKSRCVEFKFNPINENIMINHLKSVAVKEKLEYKEESFKVLHNISKGDLRKAINLMQSASIVKNYKKSQKIILDTDLCYNVSGYPLPKQILEITKILLNDKINLEKATKKIHSIVMDNGYSISIVLKEVIEVMLKMIISKELDATKYALVFSELSNLESKVSKSTFGDIYLSMFISLFKQ